MRILNVNKITVYFNYINLTLNIKQYCIDEYELIFMGLNYCNMGIIGFYLFEVIHTVVATMKLILLCIDIGDTGYFWCTIQ